MVSKDPATRPTGGLRGIVFQPKWALLVLLLIIVLALPTALPVYVSTLLFTVFLYISLGHAWNLLGGYTGLVSLGQAAFLGVGAYSGVMLMRGTGVPMIAAAVCGGVAAAIFALLISPPVFRFRGIYFAIGTMAVSEALRLWMIAWPVTGGARGTPVPVKLIPDVQGFYYQALLVLIVATLVIVYITNSKLGVGLRAIRDDEDVAQNMGVNIYRAKLVAFMVSAFLTGVVGTVWATKLGSIEPYSIFNVSWAINMVNMVIIGGIGSLMGPFIGAIFVVAVGYFLADYYAIQAMLSAIVVILAIRFAPEGIWGLVLKVAFVRRALARVALVRSVGQ